MQLNKDLKVTAEATFSFYLVTSHILKDLQKSFYAKFFYAWP